MDTGSFMHDVIDRFFQEIEDRNISIKDIENEELENIISAIIDNKLKTNRNYKFTATAKYRALTRRLKEVITMSIKYIVQSIRQSEFQVFGHELEFGKNGRKPIVVTTESGKRVEIEGKNR